MNNIQALQLSEAKKVELGRYMKAFTGPLISRIYGPESIASDSFGDILKLFASPDVSAVRTRLTAMADALKIDVTMVPQFLEDFGDVFLSVSYYRSCLNRIEPLVDDFILSLEDLRKSYQFASDITLMTTCRQIEETIVNLLAAIGGRLETFDTHTANMWEDLSAERFQEVKTHIQSYHTIIGGCLCALTLKIDSWVRTFPNRDSGGPTSRSEFIMSEMRDGIEKLKTIHTRGSA